MSVPIDRIPTSQLLRIVLNSAPIDHVTLAWVVRSLRRRSFGMVMLLLGLIAMLPGVSVVAALLLAVLAFQMMMAREAPLLPQFIARQSLPIRQFNWLVDRAIPVVKALETLIRPRWETPFLATKRVVGFVVMILAATLFVPIPLSNMIPGALTMLVAIAYLEEDGVLLCIALTASTASIAITIMEAWATLRGVDFVFQL